MKEKKEEKQKKHNYKIIIGLLLGLAIGSIGVYAATQIASSNVTYTNNNQENVQGAIDDLFSKVGKCPEGQICLLDWPWQPKYFAYGTPTTSSTTDYTSLGKNVFVGLDENGNKGVCIIRNSQLHCFKIKNPDIEQVHVQQVFSDISCNSDVNCNADDFNCTVYSYGSVDCSDHSASENCSVSSDGDVTCRSL